MADEVADLIRKAEPPRAFIAPAQVVDKMLACSVTYDPSNGTPLCAILIPVERMTERWRVVAGDEVVDAVKQSAEHAVDIYMAWPGDAEHALLLLLHQQVEGIGSRTYGHSEVVEFVSAPYATPEQLHPTPPPAAMKAAMKAAKRCIQRLDSGDLSGDLERGVITRRQVPAATQAVSPPSPSNGNAALSAIPGKNGAVRFALASCQYPAGMIDGGVRLQQDFLGPKQIGPAEQSLWRLANRVRCDNTIGFSVFAGDQIYVDATAGLFDPGTLLDRFSFSYDCMFRNKGLQFLLRTSNADVVALMDDHEVEDNWEPLPYPHRDDPSKCLMREAKGEYIDHQRRMWPAPQHTPGRLWESRQLGGYDFFLADTRTEREGRWIGNLESAAIMGKEQAEKLRCWIALRGSKCKPGFVVSPSILLPRRLLLQQHKSMALHVDSWCGYPTSLHDVLAWLYETDAHRVVFLSGDEHLSCVAKIEIECPADLSPRKVTVHSIHSSALYAPYPFANSIEEDFAAEEQFEFDHAHCATSPLRHYRCSVKTWFPRPGDGFALLRPHSVGSDWYLDVEFDLAGQSRASRNLQLF